MCSYRQIRRGIHEARVFKWNILLLLLRFKGIFSEQSDKMVFLGSGQNCMLKIMQSVLLFHYFSAANLTMGI